MYRYTVSCLFACPASGPPDTPRQKCWGVSFFCLSLLYGPTVSIVPIKTFDFGLFRPLLAYNIRFCSYDKMTISHFL